MVGQGKPVNPLALARKTLLEKIWWILKEKGFKRKGKSLFYRDEPTGMTSVIELYSSKFSFKLLLNFGTQFTSYPNIDYRLLPYSEQPARLIGKKNILSSEEDFDEEFRMSEIRKLLDEVDEKFKEISTPEFLVEYTLGQTAFINGIRLFPGDRNMELRRFMVQKGLLDSSEVWDRPAVLEEYSPDRQK